MSFAKWPNAVRPEPLLAAPVTGRETRLTTSTLGGSYMPLPEEGENPYTSLILGMINRLDEPDRSQWLRLALGLTATAVEAERAVLVEVREPGDFQVVCSFGGAQGEELLGRSLAHVESAVRSRDALLLPGLASTRAPSVICIPLIREQRVRGVMLLESDRATFRPGDLTLGRGVARRLVDPLLSLVQARQPTAVLPESNLEDRHSYGNLIAKSQHMREIFDLMDRIAATDHPVIIQGESGTGKELVARAIHFNGRRREKPFIAENCAALSDSLLEAELFGYVKGAFTGADRAARVSSSWPMAARCFWTRSAR